MQCGAFLPRLSKEPGLSKLALKIRVQGAKAKMANDKIGLKFNIYKISSQFPKFFVEKRLMLSLNPNLAFKTPN